MRGIAQRGCSVCGHPKDSRGTWGTSALMLCRKCADSYDRFRRDSDGTVADLILWAATRARQFERRRHAPARVPR